MKNIKYLLVSALFIALMTSCNKFLSEKPSKSSSLVPTTIEQLNYIFNNYSSFYTEANYSAFAGSDSYGLLTEIEALKSTYRVALASYATWNVENLITERYNTTFFSTEYSKIFRANMVLENLPKVSGTDEQKRELELEAKFIRAYSTWQLAQIYCLPYTEANKGELGVTIKSATSFEEMTARATLEETYAFIEADLEEALKIDWNMKVVNNKYNSWRANKAAVNGFAARYWLNKGDYAKALQYAEAALSYHSVLVNYNTDMRYSTIPSTVKVGGSTVSVLYPYTHDNQTDLTDMMEWKESMYFRMINNSNWWYIPSQKLIDMYNHEYDLRFKYHFVDNYSFDRGLVNPAFEYPGYIFFFKDRIPSGPSTAEMLLIKAECLARQDKVGDAMTTVNKLRDARMDSSAPAAVKHLSASNKAEAIRLIIDERMREMPFTQRWFDVRRLNHNEDPSDNVGDLTRTFFVFNSAMVDTKSTPITYTLPVGSRLYARPILQADIDASQGVIQQNTY